MVRASTRASTSCDSFLHRNQIPYERLDPDDPARCCTHRSEDAAAATYPVVVLRDGTQLTAPTMRDVATVAGLTVAPGRRRYDVVIVGGGPAGLTAAVNGASEGLETGLIESLRPGRAGRHLDPDRELHGVPVRRLRRRTREPGAATGEAAGR